MKSAAPSRSIELVIEELALRGLSPADRHVIGDAVVRVLQQRLWENPLPAGWEAGIDIRRLDAGVIQAAADMPARQLGGNIAQAVWGAFAAPAGAGPSGGAKT